MAGFPPPNRLVSIDAYRGLVMLAMVSGGLAFADTVAAHPELTEGENGKVWTTLAYQFHHVEWVGCAFWDLIQPSFMFLVGVAMPYSYAARQKKGDSRLRMLVHAAFRSLILIGLGIFLTSQRNGVLDFRFTNVLTQIGLGYFFVYLLLNRSIWTHLGTIVVILIGYGLFFYFSTPTDEEREQLTRYLVERQDMTEDEAAADLGPFDDHRAPWNKHLNAAGRFDRWLLNYFPRNEEPWEGKRFWANRGGYQTLNFVPSMATMLFGLIAGMLLTSDKTHLRKLVWLLGFSAGCFVIALELDTEMWPVHIDGWSWSLCPTVKRIWTPTWTLFSAGWTFVILAAFYLVFDVCRLRLLTFPLAIVGMNSIAVYCMAQLIKGWISRMLSNVLQTGDEAFGWTAWDRLYGDGMFAEIYRHAAVLGVIWLICLWMYRRRIFIRI